MRIKIDTITFDFIKTLMNVTRSITPEAVLYWARHEKELIALLEKKEFEPFTQGNRVSRMYLELYQKQRERHYGTKDSLSIIT